MLFFLLLPVLFYLVALLGILLCKRPKELRTPAIVGFISSALIALLINTIGWVEVPLREENFFTSLQTFMMLFLAISLPVALLWWVRWESIKGHTDREDQELR